MYVTFLGTSGSYTAPGRPGPGLLIEHRSTRVWCDAGPGTFDALQRVVDLDLLSGVVVSHGHADHCSDLAVAFHRLAYGPRSVGRLPLLAPDDVAERLFGFLKRSDFGEVFDFVPVGDGDAADIGDLSVSFAETDHPVPTVASRWSDGTRVLAYSADTGPGGTWARIAEDAHLFVCEATCLEGGEMDHHLTGAQAGAIARSQRVKSLYLTHIPPHLDASVSIAEAERTFDRPVGLAVPGARTKV